MAESPDYQPIDFAPFPSDPSQYTSAYTGYSTTSVQNVEIVSLTDGKLYVIKFWNVAGQSVNTSTTNACQPNVLLQVSRGINNTGSQSGLGFWQGQLPVSAASTGGTPADFYLEAPTPLVVRAGSVGTPNKLYVSVASNTGTFWTSFGSTILMWPLD